MDNPETGAAAESFNVGRVVNRTFETIKRNFLALCGAAALVVGIPTAVVNFVALMSINEDFQSLIGDMEANSGALAGLIGVAVIASVLIALVVLVASVVVQGAITHASIKDFNDERVDIRESLGVGWRYFWPLLGFGLLSAIGIGLGLVLFIIPGILFAMIWMVGAPCIVVENTGVSKAFERSSALTKGYKWWLLLMVVMYFFISIIFSAFSEALAIPLGINSEFSPLMQDINMPAKIVYALVQGFVQTLTTVVSAVGIASIYYELRYLKEGLGAETLASVFD